MKNGMLLLVALATSFISFAQAPAPCGTEISAEWMQAFYNRDKSHLETKSRGGGFPQVIIPIQYHIVGEDDGTGYYPLTDLLRLHCDFQAAMDPGNIHFYISEISYINNSSFYDGNSTNQLFVQYNDRDVMNVFIVEDMSGVCGYSYVPQNHDGSGFSGPNRGGVMLQQGCLDVGSTTYIHEGGHYLNLPHTFYGWEGEDAPSSNSPAPNTVNGSQVERANGTNCLNAGDGFCDTPPDYISERWQCLNPQTFQDPNGTVFTVDEDNYMSYSADACTDLFSNDQYAEMNAAPANFRSYLLNNPTPAIVPLDMTDNLSPNNQNYLSPDAPITLEWEAIPGADFYLLQVTTGNFFNPLVEEVVTTTSYDLTNLISDEEYEWRVKPYNYTWVCTDYSGAAKFSTAAFSISIDKTDLSCPGSSSGIASVVTPTGGNYSTSWNADDPIVDGAIANVTSSSINSLAAGGYEVVVVNNNTGDTAIIDFDIVSPPVLEVTVVQAGTNLEAQIQGGTAPYTVIWGNGATGTTLSNPTTGENTLILVDANGCQKTAAFNYDPSAVGINDVNSIANFTLFPNPVNNGVINLQLANISNEEVEVRVFSATGQLQLSQSIESSNNGDLSIDISRIANGMYFVQVQVQESTQTERLIVLQ